MPPGPDSRTYGQLVDETLARIPVHAPQWTDFSRSDPGIALLELFAFLSDNLLFRLNSASDPPGRLVDRYCALLTTAGVRATDEGADDAVREVLSREIATLAEQAVAAVFDDATSEKLRALAANRRGPGGD